MSASALNPSEPSGITDIIHNRWQNIDQTLGHLMLLIKILMGVLLTVLIVGLIVGIAMTSKMGLGIAGVVPILAVLAGIVGGGISLLVYIMMLSAARQAIKVTSRYAEVGKPRPGLVSDIKRFTTWLTVAQWLVILGFLSNAGQTLLLPDSSREVLPLPFKLVGVGIAAALYYPLWRGLDSVKRFFVRFSQRAMGARMPMHDTGARAAAWLQVGTVFLWIGLVFNALGILGGIGVVMVPSAISDVHFRADMGLFQFAMALFILVGGGLSLWINWLLISVFRDFRSFVIDVAATVDQNIGQTEQAHISDTWMV